MIPYKRVPTEYTLKKQCEKRSLEEIRRNSTQSIPIIRERLLITVIYGVIVYLAIQTFGCTGLMKQLDKAYYQPAYYITVERAEPDSNVYMLVYLPYNVDIPERPELSRSITQQTGYNTTLYTVEYTHSKIVNGFFHFGVVLIPKNEL